ncbi:hypothetical protein F5887DRAFT_115914 [Amanita rubescens]|nr:hypothetical protein F5887DRAFT_115914 [Amanita rubescens]
MEAAPDAPAPDAPAPDAPAPDAPAPDAPAPDAPAAPLQQPDFHQMQQHLAGVVEQIGLLPNMPAVVGFNAIIVNLREQHDQALAQRAQEHAAALAQQEAALAQQAARHQELIERLDALRDGQSRLPMQLQNAIASLDAPLQYPPNVVVGPQFPTTKKLLLKLTSKHVIDSASRLDVQNHMASCSCPCASRFPGARAPCSASQQPSGRTSTANYGFSRLRHEGMMLGGLMALSPT